MRDQEYGEECHRGKREFWRTQVERQKETGEELGLKGEKGENEQTEEFAQKIEESEKQKAYHVCCVL